MSGKLDNGETSTDMLRCAMCKDLLQDPRILPCLHSMCSTCLQSMLDANKSSVKFDCPTCQQQITIPQNGVDDFPENVYLNGVIGVQTARSSKGKQCDICSLRHKSTPATHKCLTCGDILCQNCSTSHSSTRMTIDHKVTPLDDIVKGSYDKTIRALNKIICFIHKNELLDNYCHNCVALACRECRLIIHYNHNCVNVEEATINQRQELMLAIEQLQRKASILTEIESGITDTLTDIQVTERDVLDEIESASQKLIDQIETEKQETIQKVKNQMAVQRRRCEEHMREIQEREETIRQSTKFCADVAEFGKNDEVIYLEPTLSVRLEYLDNLPSVQSNVVCQFPEVRLRNIFGATESIRFFDYLPGSPNSIPLLRKDEADDTSSPRVAVIQLARKINTFSSNDETSPKVTALAVLNNDKILVGDNVNSKIKKFTTGGKYIDILAKCKTNSIAVCDEIVAYTDNFSLTLVSSDYRRKISLTGSSFTYPICTYREVTFLLVDGYSGTFKIYDKCGEVVRSIPVPKAHHKSRRRKIAFVAANSKGEIIAVDWGTNSIILLDEQGKISKTYKGPIDSSRDWMPGDACVDIYDNVFIADQQKSAILVLDPAFNVIYKYSTRKDYLERPMNIICDSSGTIMVSGKGGVVNAYTCKYL